MKITLGKYQYEVVKDYRNGFDLDTLQERYTDYFEDYDYILGDWAYGKLRLKGFYDSKNKSVNKINNIDNVEAYIKDHCAYDCRYFLIKKDCKIEQ